MTSGGGTGRLIAALPMYARPETRAAHDEFWVLVRDGLRDRGIGAPDTLDWQTGHMEGWADPGLVLSQICNLPWRARFRDRVTMIGAADYGLPGCEPGQYYSVFVVRADDPSEDPAERAGRFAYNEALSNSGWGAPQLWARARGFAFLPHLATGAHAESARAVAEDRADIAALDAITWRNLVRWWEGARALRVIGRTDASPGQSFVTRDGQDPAPYRAAIAGALAALPEDTRDLLGLRGITVLPPDAYAIPLPPTPEEIRAGFAPN